MVMYTHMMMMCMGVYKYTYENDVYIYENDICCDMYIYENDEHCDIYMYICENDACSHV